jgi:lipopolysaccharide/colanic/teichoic acid biosynthesis glycosyltransferase
MYRKFVKRLFDFTALLIGSLVALPVVLIAELVIDLQEWKSPFLFTQIYPGMKEYLFRLV